MLAPKYHYALQRHRVYTMAALDIQLAWCHWKIKTGRGDRLATSKTSRVEEGSQRPCTAALPEDHRHRKGGVINRERAIQMIQNTWRCHVNIRIFQYYRALITFHRSCDPALLLRHISPKEANLVVRDAAIGVHVRFRLGGTSFPPILVYKVG